jgi:uncharacterized protein involved in exopolysaccharide biosynthesis
MTQTAAKPSMDVSARPLMVETVAGANAFASWQQTRLARLRLVWNRRRFLMRATATGLLVSTLMAVLIPKRYTSTTQLMPPDSQSTSGMAMMAALASRDGGVGALAGDLAGLRSSGALFIGVLRSETSQDRLLQQFDLGKVYGTRMVADARKKLDENTSISEDRKSGIITISVTDRSPQRAAALATAYVDQLNTLVAELSTSAAHRERVFLDERLKVVKQDLDDASNQLAQFSSKNNTLDIQTEGRAMLDAAANLEGQVIAAQSELQGLRQIYTANNPRVRSLDARAGELRRELEKLGGTNGNVAQVAGPSADHSAEMPYPSIRNLPLLGVKYADYFRRTKIQETVYELLTEQSEMAKVQEAKETPSVKVLDPARVPENKSFPPRLMIIFLCTFLVLAGAIVWVVGQGLWAEVDPQDPGKIFMDEVFQTVNARMPWATPNGSPVQAATHRVWIRLVRRNGLSEDVESSQKQL